MTFSFIFGSTGEQDHGPCFAPEFWTFFLHWLVVDDYSNQFQHGTRKRTAMLEQTSPAPEISAVVARGVF